MKKQIQQVQEFHEKFNHPVKNEGTVGKKIDGVLRYELLREELEEYREAFQEGDLVGIADALTDIAYILFGTYLAHGLHPVAEELFDEVQRSNMSKLDENGKPIYREDGKILKGKNYSKPNLKPIVDKVCKK